MMDRSGILLARASPRLRYVETILSPGSIVSPSAAQTASMPRTG